LINYYVYILANKKNGTPYTGFTSDISRRMREHKNKVYNGFTKKYDVNRLVYAEKFMTSVEAMVSERRTKKWVQKAEGRVD
jgi:putative endonuclease